EQRSWINIEYARGRTARQCHQGLQEACGKSALPLQNNSTVPRKLLEGLCDTAVLYDLWHIQSLSNSVVPISKTS
ncbi:hypothetical protein L9F63_026744, partial [Diploptera punctata]